MRNISRYGVTLRDERVGFIQLPNLVLAKLLTFVYIASAVSPKRDTALILIRRLQLSFGHRETCRTSRSAECAVIRKHGQRFRYRRLRTARSARNSDRIRERTLRLRRHAQRRSCDPSLLRSRVSRL